MKTYNPSTTELRQHMNNWGGARKLAPALHVSLGTVQSWSCGRTAVPWHILELLRRMSPPPVVEAPALDAVAEFRAELKRAKAERRASGKAQIPASVVVPYLEEAG